MRALVTLAFVAIISSVGCLAIIRANLFMQQMTAQTTVSVVDDDTTQVTPPRNTFYENNAGLLRIALLLTSFAIDLAAGLAVREALRYGTGGGDDPAKLGGELDYIEQQMVVKLGRMVALENEPATFEKRLWEDFYRSLLTHAKRNAMTKLMGALLAILLIGHGHAQTQEHMTWVVAVDLSQSVAVAGPDEKSEFQKNLDAVTKLLGQIPADSHLTVIGITDHSFTQPDILLSATIPPDPGYFGERLAAARGELVGVWKARSAKLVPRFNQTDILGALLLAGQIFDSRPETGQKLFVIYSDMRNNTDVLDLESPAVVPPFATVRDRAGVVSASLRDVRVRIFGVDGAGKSIPYWQGLQMFWSEYFRASGATLEAYSALRTLLNK